MIHPKHKQFALRSILLLALLYLPHVVKNWIVSLYSLESLINMPANLRVFNKIAALEVLAVLLICFILFNRDLLKSLDLPSIKKMRLLLFIVLSYACMLWYYGSQILVNKFQIFGGAPAVIIVISQFLALMAYLAFALVAVFGMDYLRSLHRKTRPQLFYFVAAEIVLTALLVLFQKSWLFFSQIVSMILFSALAPFYPVQYNLLEDGPLLSVGDFAVSIGSPCSGIESMFLFTAFFAAILALDYKRIRKGRFALFFILGFIGAYIINIVRLYLLILAGIHVSPKFAVGLFHTNAGWVLFVLYFLTYYWIVRRHIYKPQVTSRKKV